MPLTFSPGYSFAPGYSFERGARAVLVHFAAGAPDLADAAAAAAIDRGIVVNLGTDVSATVTLPGPMLSASLSYQSNHAPLVAGGGAYTAAAEVSGTYDLDPGYSQSCAGETGSADIAYGTAPGTVVSGHAIVVLVCS